MTDFKTHSELLPDLLNELLVEYVYQTTDFSNTAYEAARWTVLDSLGCLCLSLQVPDCVRLLGEWKNLGQIDPDINQKFKLIDPNRDPIKLAFDIGILIRWLDYNDTWLGQEWGHPSDNLGALLTAISIRSQNTDITMREFLNSVIRAYEIQGQLAWVNNFHQYGLDHVILVKLASCIVSSHILGLTPEQAQIALSHVWMDGPSLRVYRHGDNTISRKSWAAGDAGARGLQFAWMAGQANIPGARGARTDLKWGFEKWFCQSQSITFPEELGSHVIENILFKVQYPIEFHAQTAVECAEKLYAQAHQIGVSKIKSIYLETHHAALEIICKTGPLHNAADRDHCLQYCVALYLVMGEIQAHFFSDDWMREHSDICDTIEILRDKIQVTENLLFTKNYPDRGISHAMQIIFESGEYSERVQIEYPLGHVSRRKAAYPALIKKYQSAVQSRFVSDRQIAALMDLWTVDLDAFLDQPVNSFFKLWH